MACPDELTLDLWLADALPSDEAATVAAHVRTCATCAAAESAAHALDGELHAALALNTDELALPRCARLRLPCSGRLPRSVLSCRLAFFCLMIQRSTRSPLFP